MPGSPNPIDDLPPGGAATCANAKKVLCQWRSFVSHGEVLCHMEKFCVTWKRFVSHENKLKSMEIRSGSPCCCSSLRSPQSAVRRSLHTNLYKSPATRGCHSWSNIKENMNIYEKNSFPPLILGNSLLKMRLWEIVWALLGTSMKADKMRGLGDLLTR